ncbi:Hint domain-containing protein [Wenxinia saemankumensis]|uniref:Hint domain-containing protein n=1 Tax=Wenxinia saemankumensis TaxID=1447782 RepID=A0A1M6A7T5_9RHOB|nr:Hint domain-containing protein [Wenxinia saemankumensis]SHI32525.1 Hint domain-containing protein [Wenxinia saemankumensis]
MFQPDPRLFDAAGCALDLAPCALDPALRVETEDGWRPLGALRPGERLHTVDGGLAPLLDLRAIPGPQDAIRVPAGVLGADAETLLSPGQAVLVGTGAAMEWLNVPVALARAEHLVGHRGIALRRARTTALVRPVFAEEECLWAAGGLRLYAPGRATLLGPDFYPLLDRAEVADILG